MILDKRAKILKRTITDDDAGGKEETWAAVESLNEELLWPCKLYSKSGLAMRKPFGIDPDFNFAAVGSVIDPATHTWAVGDRIEIDGTKFVVMRLEPVGVSGPHHQRLYLEQV